MKIPKSDLKIETMRGTGPGGQHKNKTDSACRITHIPTGVSAFADERSQKHSKRKALADLEQKLLDRKASARAAEKKRRRDERIHNTRTIRTYDFKAGLVINHDNGKKASLKRVLQKGQIDLLH